MSKIIVLASNGLSSKALLQEVQKYIQHGKAALVITADEEYKERNYHVKRVTEELEKIGLSVDYFDFDKQSPEELLQYDLTEMIGGNPYYLLNAIRVHGFEKALRSFAEHKILIGWSAGALVIGPNLKLINIYAPEMNTLKLSDLTALSLTTIQMLPHYSKFLERYEEFEEKCLQYEKHNKCKVIRINDGEGIIIEKDQVKIISIS